MSKSIGLFLLLFLTSCAWTEAIQNEMYKFQLQVDNKCDVELTLTEGTADFDKIDEMKKVVLERLVEDERNIDMEMIKLLLQEIDFSKKILESSEWKEVDALINELGPWSFNRKVRLIDGGYVECLFDKHGVFKSIIVGKLPQNYEIGYEVEYGN